MTVIPPRWWQPNYKSMTIDQLMAVQLAMWLSKQERHERLAYIADELRIRSENI